MMPWRAREPSSRDHPEVAFEDDSERGAPGSLQTIGHVFLLLFLGLVLFSVLYLSLIVFVHYWTENVVHNQMEWLIFRDRLNQPLATLYHSELGEHVPMLRSFLERFSLWLNRK